MKVKQHRNDLINAIRQADDFVMIITRQSFFDDAMCWTQVEIAKTFNKPFIIFLKNGISIPEEYFSGVKKITIKKYNTKKELNACLSEDSPAENIIFNFPYSKDVIHRQAIK